MNPTILVLNAGSSSVKFSLFGALRRPSRGDVLCEGQCEGLGHRAHLIAKDARGTVLVDRQLRPETSHEQALKVVLSWIEQQFSGSDIIAAGHRIVHGGARFTAPVRIDADVVAELRRLIPLAPLHQPHHVAAIEALSRLHPRMAQIACFDTAFHHTQPREAAHFALPRRMTEEGVRRYGFHGLSYEYIAGILPESVGPQLADGKVVVAHLGNGASMCAMHARKSVATTMGMTPLDGLAMGERCGSLDPGVVLYLMQEKGLAASAISDLLYRASGLLGVSGVSGDMRELLASKSPDAAEAVDLFVYRICRELGSLAAALGGVDLLVFTAGIGEHAWQIRRSVCDGAAWLGIEIDDAANTSGKPLISTPRSRVSVWVIATDEDLMIARHVSALLAG
ncbi:MAG: acetate/propionate family kinase [Hyphomicrobiales bacterium]|nr:acetate/propionate family kinase [Hyphomicrobiales bacterium]